MKIRKNDVKKFLHIFFFFVVPCVFIYFFFRYYFVNYTNGFYVPFVLVYWKLYKDYKKEKNIPIFKIIFSVIVSILFIFGTLIDIYAENYSFPVLSSNLLHNCVYIYSFTVFNYLVLSCIYTKLDEYKRIKKDNLKTSGNIKFYFILFGLIVLFYIPYFICAFPGLCSADSFSQMYQVLSNTYTNHHPLMHTLFIKLCFDIVSIFSNSITAKVAFYSFIQLIIMSSVFAYLLMFMKKNGCNKYLFYFAWLYFVLNPLFGFYSVTMWKDILFGTFALLLMIQIYKISNFDELSVIDKVLIFISAMLVGLFRINGTFCILLISVVLLITLRKKYKIILAYLFIPTILCFVITGPIYTYFGITPGNKIEKYGMLFRQVSGVVAQNLELKQENIDYLNRLVGIDVIKENYSIENIDAVKFNENFDNDYFNNNTGLFLKNWFSIFLQHPVQYIEIYMESTYGFWYMYANGYINHIWTIDENSLGLETRSPILFYRIVYYHDLWDDFPVLRVLMRPAIIVVTMLFNILCSIYKKNIKNLLPLLVPMSILLTIMMASPVTFQDRYVYALFTCFPFIIFNTLKMFEK